MNLSSSESDAPAPLEHDEISWHEEETHPATDPLGELSEDEKEDFFEDWYHAERGDASAQLSIGLRFLHGRFVDQWLVTGSERRVSLNPYVRRSGVRRNDLVGAKWVRLAAKNGLPKAQAVLGMICEEGLAGLLPDCREAAQWYERAAVSGHGPAQYMLAVLLTSGKGVLQDHVEAVRWFQKAAAQGVVGAMTNLSVMYGRGLGVPQDYVLAHMWANLASAAGDARIAASNRDACERHMTPSQVAEAQSLARECLASNYKLRGEPKEVEAASEDVAECFDECPI